MRVVRFESYEIETGPLLVFWNFDHFFSLQSTRPGKLVDETIDSARRDTLRLGNPRETHNSDGESYIYETIILCKRRPLNTEPTANIK